MSTAPSTGTGGLTHYALFYDSPADYVSGIAAFLAGGLAAGEPTFAAVPGPRLGLIKDALNGAAGDVAFLDMAVLGANPARIIPAIREFTAKHPGRHTRFAGEPIWPGRTPAEIAEATRHEALLSLAFAGEPITICCPYGTNGLDGAVLADAARTHPVIQHGPQRQESSSYDGAALAHAIAAQPLPAPPAGAVTFGFGHVDDLAAVRRHTRHHAAAVGLGEDRAGDLITAVTELATNILVHGGGPGTLRTWYEPGTLICEVTGPGHITDPLAGRHPPSASSHGGHGLWLVSQLCDLTQQRTSPPGTTTRVHVRIS
jgi:anti-sigma regulatory factor (Ser/Thr protein kinase)